jgi:peroxiredoxin
MRVASLSAALLIVCGVLCAGDLSGRRAPGFSLPDLDLTQHDLADYRGRAVLVEFMKTDCPTCSQTARLMEEMRARFGQKIAVLAIVVPPDNQTTVRAFSMRNNLSYPVLFDCGQVASSYLKASPLRPKIQLPHLFLIDKDGQIRNDWGELEAVRPPAELAAEIAKLPN